MKRTFSASYNNYVLQVGEFENWSDALIEIEIGLTKLKIATCVGIGPICDCATAISFPKGTATAKQKIVCALMLQYPQGMSKDELQNVLMINPDSLATYLTSKQEGLADGFKKKGDNYAIKPDRIFWALQMAGEVISKCEKKMDSAV